MRSIVLKSGLVAVTAMFASLAVAYSWMSARGIALGIDGIVVSMLCPLLIAWPASARNFARKQRLAVMNAELAIANARLAEAHARLAERAERDAMTGLYNREGFFGGLEAGRRAGRSGTLLIVDVDHFKAINDTFGHQAGDRALVAIAQAIARAAGDGATVARIGGEEFAAFLPGTAGGEAQAVAERMRASVEATRLDFGGGRPALSVSIGTAELRAGSTVAAAMRLADKCLYAAKRAGRNRVVSALPFEAPRAVA